MLKTVELKNGETIAYREQGHGDQVFVMIHGNMTSSQHLDIFMDHMPEDIRIIAPDMRGFGGSSYKTPINSLMDFAGDIIELLDILSIDHYLLGGWSTGGGVAMEIAAERPEQVSHLVLVESVGTGGYPMFKKDAKGQPILTEFLTTKEDIAKDPVQVIPITTAYANKDKATLKVIWNSLIYTTNQPDDEKYDMYLDDMLTQRNLPDVDYALVHFNIGDISNGVEDGNGRVHLIKAKTLIFQGENDLVVPMNMGQSIKEGLGDLGTLVIGNWGHSPFIDAPEQLMNKIKEFIAE